MAAEAQGVAAAAAAEETYQYDAAEETNSAVGAVTGSAGVPALDSNLAAVPSPVLDSDRVEAINSNETVVIDSDLVAAIDPDMMAALDSDRGAADKSEGMTGAVSAGLVVTNQAMDRQDAVAVVSDVAVEIDSDGPVQAVLGSDRMVAIDSDGMAAMDATMVTMRSSR